MEQRELVSTASGCADALVHHVHRLNQDSMIGRLAAITKDVAIFRSWNLSGNDLAPISKQLRFLWRSTRPFRRQPFTIVHNTLDGQLTHRLETKILQSLSKVPVHALGPTMIDIACPTTLMFYLLIRLLSFILSF